MESWKDPIGLGMMLLFAGFVFWLMARDDR